MYEEIREALRKQREIQKLQAKAQVLAIMEHAKAKGLPCTANTTTFTHFMSGINKTLTEKHLQVVLSYLGLELRQKLVKRRKK